MRTNLGYLLPHPHRVGYIGWLGHRNLGDEAMAHAITHLLPDLRLVEFKSTDKTKLLERIRGGRGLLRGVVLGGGTLINSEDVLVALQAGLARYGTGAVFGTGVLDPLFWDRVPGFVDGLPEWAETLSQVPICTVRGPRSKALLAGVGIDAEVIGDPALALADPIVSPKLGRSHIGLNFGTGRGNMWSRKEDIATWAVTLIDALLDRGWRVTLLPVWAEDLSYLRDIARRTRKPVALFEDYLDLQKSLGFLRGLDVFVGQKLHSVVLAHCVHTPAYALEYRPKCREYMVSVGQEHLVMRTDALDLERVLHEVDLLRDDTVEMQALIAHNNRTYGELLRRTATRVQALFSERRYPGVT